MSRKKYNGLVVRFVPVNGTDIVANSGKCSIVSVQYYVGQEGFGECTTDEGDGDPSQGYSFNWNAAPN